MRVFYWRVVRAQVLAVALFSGASGFAQVDPRAEAYYLYCLARMYEMQGETEQSLSHYRKAIEKDPQDAFPHLALAELYAKSDRIDEAVKSAKLALELDPELAGAHRLLGNLYVQLARSQADPSLIESSIKEFQEAVRLESWDVESLQRLAELHLMREEVEAAAGELETLVQQAPDSYYALYRLAQIRRDQGDLQRAADLLRKAIEVEPRHQASRIELGRVYTELGEHERAASVYREALELAPGDSRLRVQLAYALASSGQLGPAAAEFERVLEAEQNNPEALVGLALVRRSLREYEVSETLLMKVLQAKPDHVRARYALAGVYQEMREFEKASKQLEELLSLPEGAYPTTQRAEFLSELGFARQELEDHSAAVLAFEKASRLSPEDPGFEAALIQALLGARRIDEAREACRRALGQFPSDRRFRILEAQVMFEEGRSQEAIEKLREMTRQEPREELAIRALVGLYQRQKRYYEAEQFLSQTVEGAGDSEELSFQLGAVLERQGKHEEAEKVFERVLRLNPASAPTLNYLGYMLADRGVRLQEALGYIERAVALDPFNGAYLDSLGWAHYRLGDLDLAEQNVLQAIKRLRLTGVVYDHLGDIYFRKGKRDEAVRSWKKALEQDDEELNREEVARKIKRALAER